MHTDAQTHTCTHAHTHTFDTYTACTACQKSIEASKGKLVVKEAARAVSERDDRLLAEKLEARENANKEVSLCLE